MHERSGTGITLSVGRLNRLLLYGNKLAVVRDAGRAVVGCVVSGLGEVVPVGLFDEYLARGWIADVARGERFGITTAGDRRLR
ncbi:MAG: hypothetical protein ACAI43_05485 [Phycisphaerae bacterium]